jgi:lipoprotein-anchoring transpeptidase ErfK/SrfK
MELQIDIDLGRQRLELRQGGRVVMEAPVSTARNGPGERAGSECTPRGWHAVHQKIGEGCPPNTVFVARRPTGEIYTAELGARERGRDWILTRILWLEGLEPGRNLEGEVDTLGRYIYVHGAPDEAAMGQPGSRGCIRMHNRELVELFDRVSVGTRVLIHE